MSGAPHIAVVDYGVGNLRSAEKAFQHVGADARLSSDPVEIGAADGVVVPGVGAFAGSVEALKKTGLAGIVRSTAIAARDGSGVPFLGICVGLQMLYDGSEESPATPGLGVLTGTVARLTGPVKLPQMQWNRVLLDVPDHPVFSGLDPEPWCYFVHSYAAPIGPQTLAHCDYAGAVSATVGVDRLVATQFHPEKSARSGLAILSGFAAMCAAEKQR
ncbi:MAG TPA: imidazole glycerol phosphate synthase subunit HisH [Acidimicrobiales bacterium]|nr:imidazole glycerol phosphate synthase subunit HisH [Acidimicrobiales bacterium]